MPRTIPSALNTHLQGGVWTLATLWKLTTRAAVVYGYTSHTSDLVLDGVTYTSAQGMTPTSLKISLGSGIDNMNVGVLFTSAGITEKDLRAGVLDGASLDQFLVNYRDLTMGKVVLMSGKIGEVTIRNGMFEAECRGLLQFAKQQIGMITSPLCRYKVYGGTECGLVIPDAVLDQVTSVTSDRVFRVAGLIGSGDDNFAYAPLTFSSGENDGRSMEVKKFTSATGEFELQQAMPYAVAIGDYVSAVQGCDRRWETCKARGNAARFGGEPHVPGMDKILRRPGS